jgi:hypothetical protein
MPPPHRLPELQRHLEPIRPFTPDIGEYVGWYYGVADKQPYIDHARRVFELGKGLSHARGDRAWALALQHARQILSFYEFFSLSPQDGLDYRDERAAENLRWWRQRTADKVAYWAASPHTANAAGLQLSGPPGPLVQWNSAGFHLRRWYGKGYRSIGFTFDHGTVNVTSGQPPFTPVPVAGAAPGAKLGRSPAG